mgnify:CR=1 FL=1|jgi:hypothetical protein
MLFIFREKNMLGSHLHSFLFSQVFGLYFVIMSIILISRADYYKALIAKIKAPDLTIMMISALCVFIGLFFVVMHNIWEFKPRVIVTIMCWLFVIKSVLWLTSPERMLKLLKKMWKGKGHVVICTIMLFVGIYLMARGFYLFMETDGGGFTGVLPGIS